MPTLFVVPTPIGNLEDITLRALRVLGEVDLILAEDTRHTLKLLSHFRISTPLRSYHQHNKVAGLSVLVDRLSHEDFALVSSAGTPSISDPGFELVQAATSAGHTVDVLPGPNAAVTAVVAAAVAAPGFLFMGFLPRRSKERRARLSEIADLLYSLVLYESPHRLLRTLEDLLLILGDRNVVVGRELTKLHQEIVRGRISEMSARYQESEARGEFTLVVEPSRGSVPVDMTASALEQLKAKRAQGMDVRTAVAAASHEFGLSRNDTYRLWLQADGTAGDGMDVEPTA